jgi:hypothetical protein
LSEGLLFRDSEDVKDYLRGRREETDNILEAG